MGEMGLDCGEGGKYFVLVLGVDVLDGLGEDY